EAEEAYLAQSTAWRVGETLRERFAREKGGRVRILSLGEATLFRLPDFVDGAVVFSRHPLEEMLAASKTPEELAAAFERRGYTHLYIGWSELARLHATYYRAYRLSPEEQALFRAFLDRYAAAPLPVDYWEPEGAGARSWKTPRSWPAWPLEPVALLPVAARDLASYRQRFGGSAGASRPDGRYLAARPWVGRLAYPQGQKADMYGKWLAALWEDWETLLALSAEGGPPPLGGFPCELIDLRAPARLGEARPDPNRNGPFVPAR
ncbi:MAG: hypothetical protein V1918_03275, partial [Planctomycetota bacterium]